MKKLVTFLLVGCCIVTCNTLYSFNSNPANKSGDAEHLCKSESTAVEEVGTCGSLTGLSFYASDETVRPGESVFVSVTAQDFTGVASFAWSMFYDSTIVRLDSAINNHPTTGSITIPNFGELRHDPTGLRGVNHGSVGFPLQRLLPPVSEYPAGTNKAITVVWSTPTGNPISKPQCSELFYLAFKAVGSVGENSPIAFSDKPTEVDVTDGSNLLLDDINKFVGGSVTISNSGQPPLRFTLSGSKLDEGETKCFPVSTTGFGDIFSFGTEITWNQNVLKYTQVRSFNLSDLDAGDFDASAATSSGRLTLNWQRQGSAATTVADGTNLYEICFEAVGAGGASSDIVHAEAPGTSVGSTAGAVTLSSSTTTVNIESPPGACGSIPGISFYASNESVEPDMPVYVSVKAQDFTGVASFAWSMFYDSTIIRLDSAINNNPITGAATIPNFGEFRHDPTGLRGVNHGSVGYPLVRLLPPLSEYPAGTNKAITVVWSTPTGNPISLPDCRDLFFLAFRAVGSLGEESPVAFSNKPTDIDVTDGSTLLLDDLSKFENGSVKIEVQGKPAVRLILADAAPEQGETTCIPVRVQNFDKVKHLQHTISYDRNVLEYKNVQSFNLAGLGSSNFTPNASAGYIEFDWDSPTANGTDVNDNEVIYEICFEATAAAGATASVNITDTPLDSYGIDFENDTLQITPDNASITVASPPGACGSINGLSFYGSDECVQPGETVCVGISAHEFTNVATFAWSMAYDSTIIKLDSAMNQNPMTGATTLPSFGEFRHDPTGLRGVNHGSVGHPLRSSLPNISQYPTGTNKIITVVWSSPNGSGITLPDCNDIFFLCFTACGDAGTESPIVFFDQPTGVDVTDGASILLDDLSGFEGGRVQIKANNPPPAPDNVDITHVNCKDDATGAINIDYPTGPYTFAWSPPSSANTEDISNLTAGDYTLTVTNTDDNLTSEFTYTVTEPTAALTSSGMITAQPSCAGRNDGGISVTVAGGTMPYQYSWLGANVPSGLTGSSANNLRDGSVTVSVTDDNSCTTIVGPLQLTAPQSVVIPTPAITDENCAGRNNGRISISPTGGTGTYTYNWSGPTSPPAAATISNLTPGQYMVTVKDGNDCEANETYTVGAADPIVISETITHSTNGSNGKIELNVSGGILNSTVSVYFYTWTGPVSCFSFSDQPTIENLCPGDYSVTVTDAAGCQVSETFTVENRTPKAQISNIVVSESCDNVDSGSIEVTYVDGNAPEFIFRDPSQGGSQIVQGGGITITVSGQTATITGLRGSANYLIELVDGTDVCDQRTVFLRERDPMVVTGTIVHDTDGGNGSITVEVAGSSNAFDYTWSPNTPAGSGKVADGLSADTYLVTVTDRTTGCEGYQTFEVEDRRPVDIDEPATTTTDATCPGDSDGSFTIFFSQGTAPFDIVVIGGSAANGTTSSMSYTGSGLGVGTYTVRVTDANSNTDNTTVTIGEPDAFSASAKIIPRTDAANGSIDLTVTGGTQPYTFNWSGLSPNNVEDPTNVPEGTYTCQIIDARGCRYTTQSFTVTYFRITDFNVTDAACAAANNGSISVTAQGGNAPYTYSWSNGMSGSQISNLAPGDHIVTITGTLGTEITQTYTVGAQSSISAEAEVLSDVSCFGEQDGSAIVTASNGQAPYEYQWDTGADIRTNRQVTGLSGGIANVVVTDNLGCTATASVNIDSPSQIDIEADVIHNKCNGDRDGEIFLSVSGGVPAGTSPRYDFFWSGSSLAGQRVRNLIADDYIVTVVDGNGCEEEATIIVNQPEPLKPSIVSTDADGGCNGTLRAEVIGGTPPYFYHWSIESDTIDRELTGLCSGDYSLRVTDANGCSAIAEMATIKDLSIGCLSTRAVITPDGEGRNEEFIIWCIEDYPDNTLEIYNRWGQLVWEQDDYDNTWAGTTSRGVDVPEGAYFFVFRYNQGSGIKQLKGSFTLLRK